MQSSRRVARELALKVLFQVDVGKQPLSEVLEGVSRQICMSLDSSANQAAREAQTDLRNVASQRIEAVGDRMSAQASRQIRTVSTAMATEIRRLAERASEIARNLCDRPAEGSGEAAVSQFHEASEETGAAVWKLASRESIYPGILRELAEAAMRRAEQMEAVMANQAPAIEATAAFMLPLVHGVTEKREEIDRRLAERSTGWALDRQAAVDRNIMRLAAYEILYNPDIPPGASINEAVELAKKYSTAESGRFVNGVLGSLSER